MAVIDESVTKQKPESMPDSARPVIKPPKPVFLRYWVALVALIVIVSAEVVGWQVAEINHPLQVQMSCGLTSGFV
mgnify:CR=1 FL=1